MNYHLGKSTIIQTAFSLLAIACSSDKVNHLHKNAEPISVQIGVPSSLSGDHISINGQVESRETAIISTRVLGFISSIKVKPGERVRQGQLLLSIHDGDILAKRAQAEAAIAEAEAAFQDAQKDRDRFEVLYQQQSASTKELENATLHYNSVKSKLEAARQLRNETDVMLQYTNLVAPFAGVVTQQNVDEGSMANPGMPLLVLERPNQFRVKAFIAENEIEKVKIGMNAEVIIKATGRRVSAFISEISPSAQFTGGQFSIELTLADDSGLFSGMFAHVNIKLKSTSAIESLFVPKSALVHRDQLTGLYTISENNTSQLRWLKVGKEMGDQVEVLSGLRANEKFATLSDGRLYNGSPVTVK